jgi:hypothetical protein
MPTLLRGTSTPVALTDLATDIQLGIEGHSLLAASHAVKLRRGDAGFDPSRVDHRRDDDSVALGLEHAGGERGVSLARDEDG